MDNLSEVKIMSADTQTQVDNDSTQNGEPVDNINKDEVISELNSQIEAMRSKMGELLGEAKKAKLKAKEESEAKERAKLEKAKRDGDIEQLLKSSESERSKLSEQLQKLQQSVSSEKISNESMRLATELADGSNAELLSEFISKRLKYTEEGIKVLDVHGDLTVSSLDDLKKEFTSSEKYKSLLRGIKSSGGGASGSGNSVPTTKTIDRATFDKMPQDQRMDFFKSGGKVVDKL